MKNSCLNKSPKQRILLQRVFLLVPVLSILLISLMPNGVEAASASTQKIFCLWTQYDNGDCSDLGAISSMVATWNPSVIAGQTISVGTTVSIDQIGLTQFRDINNIDFYKVADGEVGVCDEHGCSSNSLRGFTRSGNTWTKIAPSTPGTYRIGISAGFVNGNQLHSDFMSPGYSYDEDNITVTAAPAQCGDGVSNGDDDTLADINDPACHSDCDATDGDSTYVPGHSSELNSSNSACTPTVRLTPRLR